MDLALLDWVRVNRKQNVFYMYVAHQQNENVGRVATSMREVVDLRQPDRRTPMRVLVAKAFYFVDKVWMTHLRSMPDIHQLLPLIE